MTKLKQNVSSMPPPITIKNGQLKKASTGTWDSFINARAGNAMIYTNWLKIVLPLVGSNLK